MVPIPGPTESNSHHSAICCPAGSVRGPLLTRQAIRFIGTKRRLRNHHGLFWLSDDFADRDQWWQADCHCPNTTTVPFDTTCPLCYSRFDNVNQQIRKLVPCDYKITYFLFLPILHNLSILGTCKRPSQIDCGPSLLLCL